MSKYDKGYTASQDVINAQNNKLNAENAVKNYGDFTYGKQDAYDQRQHKICHKSSCKTYFKTLQTVCQNAKTNPYGWG